ncbi:MAG: hypothetical protein GKR98_03360 [Boseongicola sp.]|nr:MAG: hypothetical protein GKR98_03360 [Boseongicola sp.]
MVGEFANIIQHPQGRFKEVVLRENRLVNRFEDALHYVADTEPGSSGSPVYNSEWKLIALHHWGGPWIDGVDGGGAADFEINEGIRASSIVRKVRQKASSLASEVRARLLMALDESERATPSRGSNARISSAPSVKNAGVQIGSDGQATWTLPLEISVKIPGLNTTGPIPTRANVSVPAAQESQSDYADRQGYLPDFLPGFHIPLPRLGPGLVPDAASLLEPVPGANPFELKYHHFSAVMNKRRKLAFFTACMIDGQTAKSINRSTLAVSDLHPNDPGLREGMEFFDGAEADSWSTDPRIAREDYSGDEIYKGQKVPGFPNPRSSGRIARMFQKGHLVRRIDPAWGSNTRALEAELDTFHWTNAAPQVGFFNQGKADEDQPGTGKGNLWRAAENYVLRNAVAENQKVISFTGPVFRDDDRRYRHIQIPGRFFKVTAWVESGTLKSLALLVDQSQVFDAWPESLGGPEFLTNATEAEAFMDVEELDRVEDFLSTIADTEDLTELDFGDLVRQADVRLGQGTVALTHIDDLPIPATPAIPIPGALENPNGTADDLTRISGVGNSLQGLLNRNGIFHFSQIAAWGPTEIAIVDELLKFPGRINRDEWVRQAATLM